MHHFTTAAESPFVRQAEELIATAQRIILEKNRVLSDNTEPGGIHVPTIKDFEIVRGLSAGGYGRVFLGRKKTTGDIFAIKVCDAVCVCVCVWVCDVSSSPRNTLPHTAHLNHSLVSFATAPLLLRGQVLDRRHTAVKNQLRSVYAERDIMAAVQNPHIVRLYCSFHSRRYLYLVSGRPLFFPLLLCVCCRLVGVVDTPLVVAIHLHSPRSLIHHLKTHHHTHAQSTCLAATRCRC